MLDLVHRHRQGVVDLAANLALLGRNREAPPPPPSPIFPMQRKLEKPHCLMPDTGLGYQLCVVQPPQVIDDELDVDIPALAAQLLYQLDWAQ